MLKEMFQPETGRRRAGGSFGCLGTALLDVVGAFLLAGEEAAVLSCPRGAPGSLHLVTVRFAWFKM